MHFNGIESQSSVLIAQEESGYLPLQLPTESASECEQVQLLVEDEDIGAD